MNMPSFEELKLVPIDELLRAASIPKLTDVARSQEARFVCIRDNELWYAVDYVDEHGRAYTGFQFPVPVDDIEGVTLEAVVKPITLLKWIRRRITWLEAQELRRLNETQGAF